MKSEVKSDSASTNERIKEIISAVVKETGLNDFGETNPCFLRVGNDWKDYPHSWEPFRDLAGLIEWPSDAPSIVMVSKKDIGPKLLIASFSDPFSHTQILISQSVPIVEIVEAWISQLSMYGALSKPQAFFLENLGLKPTDVSTAVIDFLRLERPFEKKPIAISATVNDIAKEIGADEVSAFTIAEKLQKRHGEYASHRFGQASLITPANPDKHPWEKWRESVSGLYDETAVSNSHHEVLDGRLFIVGLGLFATPLRSALEAAGVWAPLLLEIDEAVIHQSGHLRDAFNEVQLAHGYKSDKTDGEDQLGIQGEVNALCEVILDRDVKPPLAIGLFGSWGAGKSFFMEKMRNRIFQRTEQSTGEMIKDVCQIQFNAWHYADTSLWASLAVEIFERLVDPEPVGGEDLNKWLNDRGDPQKAERKKLLANLETYREAKAALEQECEHLKNERIRLSDERDVAEQARMKAIQDATLTNVAIELLKDTEVIAGLKGIQDELGLTPAVDQLSGIARELQTASGFFTATWRKIENKKWTIGLLVTAVVLLVLAGTFKLSGDHAWLASLIPAVGSVLSAVVAASKHILPAAENANKALQVISTTIEKVTEVEERLLGKRSKEERELEIRLAEYNEKIEASTRSIAALNEKIAATTAQAESLSVGRRLYDFLADRAAGYQKHQGIVGMLHRDFRLLDAQIRAQSSTTLDSSLPKIERVILYIDDLDRCSPEKVLEVLEAVHLLLALELFIVVVGVDPRWLERSLRHQYRNLCLSDDPSKDPYLHVMPFEYLEKIFQIPLTLPEMGPNAYSKLISSLAPQTALPTTTQQAEASSTSTRRAASPDSPGGPRAPTRSLLKVQAGSAAAGRGGTSIDLTSAEVLFMQTLAGLVDTPRAAKRLMNTYRLIRATQHVGSRSRFLGADGRAGEYYAVLTLLAIAAGFPTLADRVLVALEDQAANGNTTWEQFVDTLDPNRKQHGIGNNGQRKEDDQLSQNNLDQLSQAEAAEWENMFNGLKESLSGNELHDIKPYKEWGRPVARFSFTV